MKTKAKSAAAPAKKRVIIVDDHPMMREGLAQLLNAQPDFVVCGEAGDASLGLDQIKATRPDLVLADITLPGRNGIEFIKDIQALAPETSVLVLSMHDESLYAERVLRAGGRGYIMKQEGGKKILEAMRQVISGKIYLSAKMSAQILEVFSGRRGPDSKVETLSDREFEIYQLIGQGMDTKDMARQLNLSPKTIDVHRANIKAKLKLASMSELIRHAVRWVESEGQGQSR